MRALLPALLLLPLAACGSPAERSVDHAWVRLSAAPRGPAAAYFTLHGGKTDATLISVSADTAIKAEMHETMQMGGSGQMGAMTEMKPLASVALPAGQTVAFQPGGRHVMLFDVNPGIKPGGRMMMLTFSFSDGMRLARKATVVGPADPVPDGE